MPVQCPSSLRAEGVPQACTPGWQGSLRLSNQSFSWFLTHSTTCDLLPLNSPTGRESKRKYLSLFSNELPAILDAPVFCESGLSESVSRGCEGPNSHEDCLWVGLFQGAGLSPRLSSPPSQCHLPPRDTVTPGCAFLGKGDSTYSRWPPTQTRTSRLRGTFRSNPEPFLTLRAVVSAAGAAAETLLPPAYMWALNWCSVTTEPWRNPPYLSTALHLNPHSDSVWVSLITPTLSDVESELERSDRSTVRAWPGGRSLDFNLGPVPFCPDLSDSATWGPSEKPVSEEAQARLTGSSEARGSSVPSGDWAQWGRERGEGGRGTVRTPLSCPAWNTRFVVVQPLVLTHSPRKGCYLLLLLLHLSWQLCRARVNTPSWNFIRGSIKVMLCEALPGVRSGTAR